MPSYFIYNSTIFPFNPQYYMTPKKHGSSKISKPKARLLACLLICIYFYINAANLTHVKQYFTDTLKSLRKLIHNKFKSVGKQNIKNKSICKLKVVAVFNPIFTQVIKTAFARFNSRVYFNT